MHLADGGALVADDLHAQAGLALRHRRPQMEADAIPDAPQVLLVVALDRQAGQLGQPAPLFERSGDVRHEGRRLRQREVAAPHLLPRNASPLHGGRCGVDLRRHRRRQPEAPVVSAGQFVAGPDAGAVNGCAHGRITLSALEAPVKPGALFGRAERRERPQNASIMKKSTYCK
jgi:hypothetical protein